MKPAAQTLSPSQISKPAVDGLSGVKSPPARNARRSAYCIALAGASLRRWWTVGQPSRCLNHVPRFPWARGSYRVGLALFRQTERARVCTASVRAPSKLFGSPAVSRRVLQTSTFFDAAGVTHSFCVSAARAAILKRPLSGIALADVPTPQKADP